MWKLSTVEKKSCTQLDIFVKEVDGKKLIAEKEIGWRWAWFTYEDKPDITDYDPNKDQIEVYSLGDVQDMEQNDGCWETWTWPEELDEDEIERLEEIFNEEDVEGLENEGWELDETEYWVTGPLELEEVKE